MEGTLKVTPEKLISAAQEFSTCGQAVSANTQQMTTLVTGLSSVWTGEAATAYTAKFNQLQDDITRFNKMIQEHVTDLQEMARVYDVANTQAQEASSGLPTDPLQ
ncbi:MAG: WXG100 family type VII secretion target [Lachnospiraceae bacterium]|nr:WXG100 family type VII secretion target [Lachnospiraceae bacterium]